MKLKYAIVRVDNKCPEYTEEDFECPFSNDKIECEICRQGRYGDTKEQLIRKIAQILFRRKLKVKISVYKKVCELYGSLCFYKKELDEIYAGCLDVATEIVEFLGVTK